MGNQLEKAFKVKSDPDETETIQRAISCLQITLQMDFKAADIEVGVVSNSKVGFVKLGAQESPWMRRCFSFWSFVKLCRALVKSTNPKPQFHFINQSGMRLPGLCDRGKIGRPNDIRKK